MTTQSTNINAALIKNATNMQNQLLEFSHQLSNLSIASLDGNSAYQVTGMTHEVSYSSAWTGLAAAAADPIGAVPIVNAAGDDMVVIGGKYTVAGDDATGATHALTTGNRLQDITTSGNDHHTISSITQSGGTTYVAIGDNGVPSIINEAATFQIVVSEGDAVLGVNSPLTLKATSPFKPMADLTDIQKVNLAIAVVASNLRGVGVGDPNIASIFKDGITPTSLAAVESQLKGHHDAVLQLALETLSRSTQLMQQIARKLSS